MSSSALNVTGDAIPGTELTPRDAVTDALHRCILGLDSNDRTLFASACLTNEEIVFVGGGFCLEGWTAVNQLFGRLFELVTTHIVTNVRVHFEHERKASLTAHAVGHHVRPEDALKIEDTSYTSYSLYSIDLVKDGGDELWKIKRWEVKVLWTTGDKAVLHP